MLLWVMPCSQVSHSYVEGFLQVTSSNSRTEIQKSPGKVSVFPMRHSPIDALIAHSPLLWAIQPFGKSG